MKLAGLILHPSTVLQTPKKSFCLVGASCSFVRTSPKLLIHCIKKIM